MATSACPRCSGGRLLKGTCGAHQHIGCGFAPDEVRHGWWDWNPLKVWSVEDGVTACLDCGLVWFEVVPAELQALIERNGTEKAKQ